MTNKMGLQNMKGKHGPFPIITPFVIILAIAYWYFTAPPPGWCSEQNRVLSDKEVVELAGVYTAKQSGQKMINGKLSPPLFCCYFRRLEGGFWSKTFRMDEGIQMGWWYERSEESIQEFNSKDKYSQVDRTVNSCVTKNIYFSNNTTDSLPEKNSLSANSHWNCWMEILPTY